MTFPDITMLRRLAEAVTEKDWHVGRHADHHWAGQVSAATAVEPSGKAAKVLFSGNTNFPQEALANAAYVAAVNPNNVLAMLDYIEALEARISQLTLASMPHSELPSEAEAKDAAPAPVVATKSTAPLQGGWQLTPGTPTSEMIEAGAQRLVSWEDGCTWPNSWDALTVAAARQEAERVWRSMWEEASKDSPLTLTGQVASTWKDHQTAELVNNLTDVARTYAAAGQLREQIRNVVMPLAAQLKAPLPVVATPALIEVAKAMQTAVDDAYHAGPVVPLYPRAEVDIHAVVERVLNKGPLVRLPVARDGYALIPVLETEDMHDAVMALLYKGVSRSDTQQFVNACIAGAKTTELKAHIANTRRA